MELITSQVCELAFQATEMDSSLTFSAASVRQARCRWVELLPS